MWGTPFVICAIEIITGKESGVSFSGITGIFAGSGPVINPYILMSCDNRLRSGVLEMIPWLKKTESKISIPQSSKQTESVPTQDISSAHLSRYMKKLDQIDAEIPEESPEAN
jgi:hypothetical protein